MVRFLKNKGYTLHMIDQSDWYTEVSLFSEFVRSDKFPKKYGNFSLFFSKEPANDVKNIKQTNAVNRFFFIFLIFCLVNFNSWSNCTK